MGCKLVYTRPTVRKWIRVTQSNHIWRYASTKVLKVGSDDQYFIHYQGWNKKWDKWVHASLLMKEGPEADKYAKDLEEQEKKRKAAREAEKRG